MLYEDCKKFVKGLIQENHIKECRELDARVKLYEYIKEIEKIHRWNRLFGYQKDENLYIDSTRNYGKEYYEKRRKNNGRNCK